MIYYKVIHLFFTKQASLIHYFNIGTYDSKGRAEFAAGALKIKDGFSLHPDKFYIIKILHFKKPKLLNQTF